jgi:hypothetical protein
MGPGLKRSWRRQISDTAFALTTVEAADGVALPKPRLCFARILECFLIVTLELATSCVR